MENEEHDFVVRKDIARPPPLPQTRSERNDKVRPLCLTSTALEYGGKGNGGATPSPLQLIRLADVIGAKASRPSQRERKSDGGEGGDVKSKRGNAFHKLEVFAYVVSGGDNVGCSSCVGYVSKWTRVCCLGPWCQRRRKRF